MRRAVKLREREGACPARACRGSSRRYGSFKEFGLGSRRPNLPTNHFGVALNPNVRSSQPRLLFGDRLGMQDCIIGDFYIILQLWIEIQSGMSLFGGLTEIACQQDCVRR